MLSVAYVSLGKTVIIYKYSDVGVRIKTVTMQLDKFLSLTDKELLQYATDEKGANMLANEVPDVKFMSLNKEK